MTWNNKEPLVKINMQSEKMGCNSMSLAPVFADTKLISYTCIYLDWGIVCGPLGKRIQLNAKFNLLVCSSSY
jgi:hypothetical protein